MVPLAQRWALGLSLIPLALAGLAAVAAGPSDWLTVTLVVGLLIFGAVFAINSAVHSFLILAFSHGSRVTLDVGFYYMSNATGRLLGTLFSGLSYQYLGLAGCLATAGVFAFLSFLLARKLKPQESVSSASETAA